MINLRVLDQNGESNDGAVIQAITPGFIIPFYDTTAPFRSWLASDVPAQMSERERRELETLMLHRIVGPQGVFAISPDAELTERLRALGRSGDVRRTETAQAAS